MLLRGKAWRAEPQRWIPGTANQIRDCLNTRYIVGTAPEIQAQGAGYGINLPKSWQLGIATAEPTHGVHTQRRLSWASLHSELHDSSTL